ncbi:hypothetical protein ODJ79_45415 [Actinoplanes sp. KI2]|uniref:hypothetical protein n=1 Tax=Actinoplanes sp. KI2 TaxID=2983315 RepID=UPI0021D5A00E|nr:hypothetical protein [Actinoplanes sp. KI2]MCU7730999.1 hypothetical protein [Actinoplanes sp. KI2]
MSNRSLSGWRSDYVEAMRTFLKRINISCSAILALSLGITLSSMLSDIAGTVRPASAAVAEQPAAGRHLAQQQLGYAVLTTDDLPAGYQQLDITAAMLAGLSGPGGPDGALLAASKMVGSHAWQPTGRSADPAAWDETPMELAAFKRDPNGPVLVQKIVGTGEETARDLVRSTESVLECCPLITSEDLRIALTELPRMPRLGDASVAMAMTLTVKNPGFDLVVQGNLVVFAQGGVFEEIVQVGVPESMHDTQFAKIATTAFRKLGHA